MTSGPSIDPDLRSDDAPHASNALIRFSVNRRVTMSMCVLGLLVLGWLSLTRLPLEFMPEFASANVSVSVPYPSSSPAETERLIVQPLEDMLGTLNGLEQLRSTAGSGSANINLSFVEGTDMELAVVEVRDRIDRARDRLPDDVERINIRRFQSSDIPILRSSLASESPRDDLYEFVEDVMQPRLERLEGVAQVNVRGIRSRELQINLLANRLEATQVDQRQLASALRNNNINVSAGYLKEGSQRFLVRTLGEFKSLEQIRDLPIRADGLKLGDVAEVTYDFPRQEQYNFLNGSESVSISINKTSTANLLKVVESVKEEYQALMAMPDVEDLSIRHFHDASVDVTEGLTELSRAGLLGGGLAVVFVFLFIRKFRTTLLVAIAVPLSLVTTFVIIFLARQADLTNMTLNVMSLMGLMLAIGMLLDNSIVVIESIYRHRHDLGKPARQAALDGASEVAMPIIASTATTMCVFLPLVLTGGGGQMRFMGQIGVTVCIVMLASLLVSLTVVPLVASVLLTSETRTKPRFLMAMIAAYGWVVRLTLRYRAVFFAAIVLLLWGSWNLYNGIERTFEPPSEGRQITLFVDAPSRVSAAERQSVYDEVYALLNDGRKQWDIADIAHDYRTDGARSRRGGNRFELYLTPEEEATVPVSEVRDAIREALPVRAGVGFKIAQAQGGRPGSGSSGVRVELVGDNLDTLELLSHGVVEQLTAVPFLRDVDTSLESGADEIVVTPNRERSLQAGLSSQGLAQSISSALSSRNLSFLKSQDREIGIVMQYREEDRESLRQLRNMPVFSTDSSLPVAAFADFKVQPGAKTIERENRQAKIEFTSNTVGEIPSFVAMGMMRRTLGAVGLPEGYEWRFGRSFRDGMEDDASMNLALIMAVLLIFMIMSALFENVLQPLTILLSIPFAFTGVGLIMKLAGQPRSTTATMGLLILAGIVVNNAIVLIDHINRLRREGMSRNEAVVLGGQHRLRPILLTAMTTILGLSPMVAPFFWPEVFGRPEGRAAYWAPIGLVLVGGLAASTVLTLLVIPTFYTLIDDVSRIARRVARAV